MQHNSYRPDIDGLRAIAVASVVIYHINKYALPAGFVGVDIFFVISGFLITGVIAKSILKGDFSFREFYVRRIRRIVPATAFVILVTLFIGARLMLPEDVVELGYSAVASLFSVANIYYWLFLDTGYFADSADLVPLLHMWSLGVEEQFYLLWPALLFVAFRFSGKKAIFIMTLILAMASFIYGELMLKTDALFSYYMLPARAGEILIGGLVYLSLGFNRQFAGGYLARFAAALGLAMIALSLLVIDVEKGFPGLWALLPSIGTALVIWGGCYHKGWVSAFLSNKLFVTIGLYSFSLYLWHWPVLAFYRYIYGEPQGVGVVLCLAVIAAGTLVSYHFVEKPFRYGFKIGKIGWQSPLYAAVFIVSGLSAVTHLKGGQVPFLSSESNGIELARLEEITKPAFRFDYVCQMPRIRPDLFSDERCIIGPADKAGEPSVLVFGDSNASHYVGYIKALAEHFGFSARNVAHSACVPFLNNADGYVGRRHESCMEFNRYIMDKATDYDLVIVGGSWTAYVSRGDHFYHELEETIKYLSSRVEDVVVALKIPVIANYDRQCLQKSLLVAGLDCFDRGRINFENDYEVNRFIVSLADRFENVHVLSLQNYLCENGACSAYIDGEPVYYDQGHLSLYGSELLGKMAIDDGSVNTVFRKYAGR